MEYERQVKVQCSFCSGSSYTVKVCQVANPATSFTFSAQVPPSAAQSALCRPPAATEPTKMSLSEKSNEEIRKMLDECGIKHGPVQDTTRKLYEKRLEKATKTSPVKSSPDKTFYREEEEEITYVTYRNPVRSDGSVEMLKRRGHIEADEDEEPDHDPDTLLQFTSRTVNHSVLQSREALRKPAGSRWKVVRLLLLLAVLAAVFYYAYCRLIGEENPFGFQ